MVCEVVISIIFWFDSKNFQTIMHTWFFFILSNNAIVRKNMTIVHCIETINSLSILNANSFILTSNERDFISVCQCHQYYRISYCNLECRHLIGRDIYIIYLYPCHFWTISIFAFKHHLLHLISGLKPCPFNQYQLLGHTHLTTVST